MEAEIIPMCEDQGIAIVSWAALGGGQLNTAEQRRKLEQDPDASKPYGLGEHDVKVCDALERVTTRKNATFQEIALAYLFHQSTYVFPIVGVQTVEHVKTIPGALRIKLSKDDIDEILDAAPFTPLFPILFLRREDQVQYETNGGGSFMLSNGYVD